MALTYEPISSTTLSSASSSVVFSSIPQTYTDLRLVVVLRETSSYADARIQFNSDTGTNYYGTWFYPSGATPATVAITNATGIWIAQNSNGSGSNQWSMLETDINNYSNSTNYKTTLSKCSNASYNNQIPGFYNFTWNNTSAITRIEIYVPGSSTTWQSGSIFTLYGIKAA